jgi:hypothetical protein
MIQEQKYQGLIAACGMNCGLCIGYLRKKNPVEDVFRDFSTSEFLFEL